MKSWRGQREALSFTKDHKQHEADGQTQAFPPSPFQGRHRPAPGHSHATPARSSHFCAPIALHSPRSLCCLCGQLGFGRRREALEGEPARQPCQLTPAALPSLRKAPRLRATSTFSTSKRVTLSNCLISAQRLLPFILESLLQFIDRAVFSSTPLCVYLKTLSLRAEILAAN